MSLESWLIFSSIALVATLSPGPAVLLVTTHSLQYGPVRAICTILGNITGLFFLSLLSVLSLTTLIRCSTTAFLLTKLLGGAYLVYLGIGLWRNGLTASPQLAGPAKGRGRFQLYTQGLTVALTNPKAIAFTTALFPQFVETDQPLSFQFLLLVTTFMAFSFLCLTGYGLVSHLLHRNGATLLARRSTGKIFGGIFILTGAALASASRQ